MTCNYFEYRDMTEKLFFGVALTEDLDKAGKLAEELRQKYYGEFAGAN